MSSPPESPDDSPVEKSLSHTDHIPTAELFFLPTTVDCRYIQSLIRKLLPENDKDGETSLGCDAHDAPTWVKAWEEFGCILSILAANKTNAEFMVGNSVVEILSSTLTVSKSARITEISLGILGNLAHHAVSWKKIISTSGLIGIVLKQLFLDDTQCLCEACGLITLFLQSEESYLLAEALQSERFLCRILWIVENISKLQLLQKCINLLLAVAKSKQEVVAVLIPPPMNSGLPRVLVHLLSVEIEKLIGERLPERYSILHLILETFEALSDLKIYPRAICLNKELFQLLVQLIRRPDKAEFANSCIIATVLTARILAGAADLALEISQDQLFLQGLLDVFAFASDDIVARTAIWIILARSITQIQNNLSSSKLHQCVSVLTSRSEVVEDELNYGVDDSSEHYESFTRLRLFALDAIVELLSQWRNLKDQVKRALSKEWHVNEGHVDGMLRYCDKYTK